ncbi:MAG: MFS transporter [Chloroflexota bacterium]
MMTKTFAARWQSARQGILAPLSIPDFRRMWIANALWWAGRFMEFIIVGWLVLDITDSPLQVAAMGFYRSIPFLLVGFFSGPILDRLGRRTTILLGQTATLIGATIIALLLWFDLLTLWHLGVLSFLMGSAWSLDWPARRSFVPDLVGKERTVDALLLENFAQNVARISGPFAGGVLIASFGAKGAFTALAVLSLIPLVIISGVSRPVVRQKTKAIQQSAWANIVEGLRYVRKSPPILGSLLITVIMNLLIFPYVTLLPVFARDVLGQGPTGLGILGSAAGIGAFVGLVIIGQIRNKFSLGWIFVVGSTLQAAALVTFSLSAIYELSFALLLLTGIGQACFGIMQSSIILLASSDEMRSRAMGTLVLAIGAGPFGQLEIGMLAEAVGAPLAVRLHASLAVVLVIVVSIFLPDLRNKTHSKPEQT